MQLGFAHQNVRRRAETAAQRPRLHLAFAHGRLTDDRHAHAHIAAQIIDVVNAAVQNRVGRAAVHLRIDDAGQIRAAFGGEKAPHLNRQFAALGQRAQIRRKLTKRRKRVAVILMIEIREIQPRPVFHAHGFKAVCRFQFLGQFGQHRQLFALAVEFLALCAGKIMHALDADVRRIGTAVKRGEEIPLVHPELRTRRQPEQNGINPAARARRFVNQADVQRRFTGEMGHAQIHRAFYIGFCLVHAGKEHHVRRNAHLTADFQLAGAAHFQRADQAAHGRNQKRIGLDGVAQADGFRHDFAHGAHARFQLHLVKDEARRAEALGNGKEVIHVVPPFWRPLRRHIGSAARRGRFCRFC